MRPPFDLSISARCLVEQPRLIMFPFNFCRAKFIAWPKKTAVVKHTYQKLPGSRSTLFDSSLGTIHDYCYGNTLDLATNKSRKIRLTRKSYSV